MTKENNIYKGLVTLNKSYLAVKEWLICVEFSRNYKFKKNWGGVELEDR